MAHRILVVEDDPTLRLVLRDNLQTEGYNVEVAADGASAVKSARATIPDLVVLDLTLPDHDGFELLPILRSLGQVPIIVLTARIQRNEKLKGLALGADDYITKPFDPAELLARIRAVLRRVRPTVSRIRLGSVTIDFITKQASSGRRTIPLTHREFELLSYLADRRDVVVPRNELLRAVWGYLDRDIVTRTVDFAIARLRRKIEEDPHHPHFIRTAHGDGYCLSGVADDDSRASQRAAKPTDRHLPKLMPARERLSPFATPCRLQHAHNLLQICPIPPTYTAASTPTLRTSILTALSRRDCYETVRHAGRALILLKPDIDLYDRRIRAGARRHRRPCHRHSGAVLPGVTVSAENMATNIVSTTDHH